MAFDTILLLTLVGFSGFAFAFLPFFSPFCLRDFFSGGPSESLSSERFSRRLRPPLPLRSFLSNLGFFLGRSTSSPRGLPSLPESETYSSLRPRPPFFLSGGGSLKSNAFFVFSTYSCRFCSITSLDLCFSSSNFLRSSSCFRLNAARSSSCLRRKLFSSSSIRRARDT